MWKEGPFQFLFGIIFSKSLTKVEDACSPLFDPVIKIFIVDDMVEDLLLALFWCCIGLVLLLRGELRWC
jgi:hypothetical protein